MAAECIVRESPLFPALTAFYEALPDRPFCGHLKDAPLVRVKAAATQYPYLQVNRPGLLAWLVLDIDRESVELLNTVIADNWAGLPMPNFIVRSPDTHTAHLYYRLHTPVNTGPNGRVAPKRYLKKIKLWLTQKLGADPDYVPRIAKNPFATEWDTYQIHSDAYEFADFAEYLDFPEPGDYVMPPTSIRNSDGYQDLAPGDGDPRGRNCDLFRRTSLWAYCHVNGYRNQASGGYQRFTDAVYSQAHKLNTYRAQGGRLDDKEVDQIARSISRWVWHNYTGNAKAVGAMADQLDKDLSLQERQRLAAERTHDLRKASTTERIAKAVQTLERRSQRPTKAAVAAEAGMARNTVARHWDEALELLDGWREAARQQNAQYGAHQVAAAVIGSQPVVQQSVSGTAPMSNVVPFPVRPKLPPDT